MAKKARDTTNIDALPSVKLFVASNGWPYKPRWSVEAPLIFFFGGAADNAPYIKEKGHICKRCKDAISPLMMRPGHHEVFIVDLSEIASPSQWREELEKPGRATKMLSKWLVKFNPSAATVVVQGVDVKLIDRVIRSWRTPATSHVQRPVDKVIIVGNMPGKKIMASISELANVIVAKLTAKALAAAVAPRQSCPADRTKRQTSLADSPKSGGSFCTEASTDVPSTDSEDIRDKGDSGCSDMFYVAVEFSLDPVEKALLQTPIDISAQVLSETAAITIPSMQEAEQNVLASAKMQTHHLDFGFTVSDMIAQVVDVKDSDGMVQAVLSDVHGTVDALFSQSAKLQASRGSVLVVNGRTISLKGRLVLMVESATPHKSLFHGYRSTRMGQRNVSERVHQYGCVVLRGSRCLLMRCDDRACIPVAEPRAFESRQQAATRAVAECCKVLSEEILLLHDVAPAVAYLPGTDGQGLVVLTVFIALATSEKKSDACGCDEPLDSEREPLYDWYAFEEAISFVHTKAERACILTLTSNVAAAVDAGVVSLNKAGGFGPKVHAVHGDCSLNQILALMQSDDTPKRMLHDSQATNDHIMFETRYCQKDVDTPGASFYCQDVIDTPGMSFWEFEQAKRIARMQKLSQMSCGGKCAPGCGC